jgi:Uncharacterized conserved protein (some members contain a von Willebrand factor type A (vWA) domain)
MHAQRQEADGLVYVSLAQLMALEFKARALSFVARQPHGSILSGNHASRLRGRGLNFDELRRYQPGDDLRHLDWRASLRTGKPVVRTFTEERDRPALIVVDQRMSMFLAPAAASNPPPLPNWVHWPHGWCSTPVTGWAPWYSTINASTVLPRCAAANGWRRCAAKLPGKTRNSMPLNRTAKTPTNWTRFCNSAWPLPGMTT